MASPKLKAIGKHTREGYERVLKRAFGDTHAQGAPDEAVVKSMPENVRAVLRAAILRYWREQGDEAKGIRMSVSVPHARSVKRARRYPAEPEVAAFERAIGKLQPEKARALMRVALRSGARCEELLSVPRWRVDEAIATGRLTLLGKGDKERVLPAKHLKADLQAMLELPAALPHSHAEQQKLFKHTGNQHAQWETPGELLSSGMSSTIATQKNLFARYVKRCAALAGLDPRHWSPHMLRHAYASRMNRDGAPTRTVQAALGHASIATTERYLHVTPEDIAKYVRGGKGRGAT